ncbi:MAG: hypothetical protein WAM07_13620, partial [Halobacillus sp.]
MKKVSLLFSAILLIFFLIACTESSSTSADQNEKEEPSSEKDSSDKQKKEEASSEEKKKEETKPPQPYQPIEPAEDAKPLKESMSEEQLAKMPKVEAHGGERERMIPVGQTLVKGAEDQTDGPLKDHRLVAYYGHPNSTNMGILGEMEPDALMEKLKEQT